MARGEYCRVTNCKNKITYKGTVCGTHKWRMKKFNSYDLPTYTGEPNVYVPKPGLPEGIVKDCKNHGHLTIKEVYPKYYKNAVTSYNCKRCSRETWVLGRYEGMAGRDTYDKMFKEQNGVCAICHQPETMRCNNKTDIKKLSVDHCHKTHKVRGLTCASCNTGIGYFKDSIELMLAAVEYLKKHQ